jgi:hypothetical protein
MTGNDRNREQGGQSDRKPGRGRTKVNVHSDPRRTREQHDDNRDNQDDRGKQRPMREDVRQDDTPKAG